MNVERMKNFVIKTNETLDKLNEQANLMLDDIENSLKDYKLTPVSNDGLFSIDCYKDKDGNIIEYFGDFCAFDLDEYLDLNKLPKDIVEIVELDKLMFSGNGDFWDDGPNGPTSLLTDYVLTRLNDLLKECNNNKEDFFNKYRKGE